MAGAQRKEKGQVNVRLADTKHQETLRVNTPMFIAALFIIAKIQKQPKCPSAAEWIKKMWYIYTMEH